MSPERLAGDQRVTLIRHGETEWSRDHRHTGWIDIALTPRGQDQARALAPVVADWTFDGVLCSPLRRARETAELVGLGDVADIDDDLREWNYGAYEGRTADDIQRERPGWSIWADGVEGGETIDEVATRAERVISRVRRMGLRVALVAHGHFLRILATRWMGVDPRIAGSLYLGTAAVSVLGYERDVPAILCWNDETALRHVGSR